MSVRTISNEEMARRLRVSNLNIDLTDCIGRHAVDAMTPLDVIEALTMQLQRYTRLGLLDEREAE